MVSEAASEASHGHFKKLYNSCKHHFKVLCSVMNLESQQRLWIAENTPQMV